MSTKKFMLVRSPLNPYQNGFSMIQLIVAISVLGILGALTLSKWNQFSKRQSLIGEGKAMLIFMEEARSFGLKKNKVVGVRFDGAATTYQLFEDKNINGKLDAGETIRTLKLSNGISFGLPSNPPTSGPNGQTLNSNGLSGAWAIAWTAAPNLSAIPSSGVACFKHGNLADFSLCLSGSATSQKCTAALWDGMGWITL